MIERIAAIGLAAGLLVTTPGCGGGSSLGEAEARRGVERILEDTISQALDGRRVVDDGQGTLRCEGDPTEVRFDGGFRLEDVGAEMDALIERIWARWQQSGFEAEAVGLDDGQPNVNAMKDGFHGEIVGNRERGFISVGVSSPCADPIDGGP